MCNLLNNTIKIAVSSCLTGEAVRYDGTDKKNTVVSNHLSAYFSLQVICPEIAIGLGIPRLPIRMIEHENNFSVVEINNSKLNYTDKMLRYAKHLLPLFDSYCGYIVKERSPSCGYRDTPRFSNSGKQVSRGAGLFTEQVINNKIWLPIISEIDLNDRALLDNFLERIFIVHLWRNLNNSTDIFYAKLQDQLRLRGTDVESLKTVSNATQTDAIFQSIMSILNRPITKVMQLKFLQAKVCEYQLESTKIPWMLQKFRDDQVTLKAVIANFQNAFEEFNHSVNSNYFYPDKREIDSRECYFGH
ncbi:hypothetical protein MNBD_GAMMA22-2643 [hydrothermal vent metagenome]|uniref:Uncharacterized protein n=1 Tax=hydrothermal vent metagenome TaxID=652676 RepID=A0A3B0ZPL5_9ZZZZ